MGPPPSLEESRVRKFSVRPPWPPRGRTVKALTMVTVTLLTIVDIALRLNVYHTRTHPTIPIVVLSVVIALLVGLGATFGGALVYEYGFNVETAGDSPVWHASEQDVLPG